MMQFPVHVYRSPGNYVLRGKSYKLASVASQEELQAHLDAGWHLSAGAAFEAAGEAAIVRRKVSDWRSQKKAAKRKREFKIAKAQARAEKAARDAGLPPPTVALQPVPADDAPPTRAEMMQQAEILGIKADKRWSDATLMAKISAAMNPI
jgi:hypothetical protein